MRSAPDATPTCAPDSFGASGIALDSGGVLAIGIGPKESSEPPDGPKESGEQTGVESGELRIAEPPRRDRRSSSEPQYLVVSESDDPRCCGMAGEEGFEPSIS